MRLSGAALWPCNSSCFEFSHKYEEKKFILEIQNFLFFSTAHTYKISIYFRIKIHFVLLVD